jgi:hypothetical protein
MVKAMNAIYKPVTIDYGQVHIGGGFLSKPAPVVSKRIVGHDKQEYTFVKMGSSEQWLLHATCGKGARSIVGFGRTSLVDLLRTHIVRLCDGTDALEARQPVVTEDSEYDPMDEINNVQTSNNATVLHADAQGRTRYYGDRARNCITTVNVPCNPPELDPTCRQMRAVTLYITDRKTVWLLLADVSWAIRYLFDQHRLKGVAVVDDDDPGPGGPVAGGVPDGQ